MPSFNTFTSLIVSDYVQLPDGTFLGVQSALDRLTTGSSAINTNFIHLGETGTLIATTQFGFGGGFFSTGASTGIETIETEIAINDTGIIAAATTYASSGTFPNRGYLTIGNATVFEQTLVQFHTGGQVAGVAVEVQSDNTILVVWSDDTARDGDGAAVVLQRYTPFGVAIGSPITLNSATVGNQTEPDIVLLPDDSFVLVYLTETGGNSRARFETFNADGTPTGVSTFVSPPGHDASAIEIVQLTNGNFAMSYVDVTDGGVYTRVVDATGTTIGGPVRVSDPALVAPADDPTLLALDDGTYMVSYEANISGSSNQNTIFAQQLDAFGNTIGTADIVQSNVTNQFYSQPGAIVQLADGSVVVGGRTVLGTAATDDYVEMTGPGDLSGYEGNDQLLGSTGDDTIRGGTNSDILLGYGGNDRILGGKADSGLLQLLDGGGGDDYITSVDGSVIRGGTGNDVIVGGGEFVRGGLQGAPTSANDTIEGGAGNDVIYARDGSDMTSGGAGDDIIRTGIGADTVHGDNGNDLIVHGDNFFGAYLDGGGNSDTIFGGGANDTLIGGAGNDRLRARGGDDILEGGAGVDRFIFSFEEDGASASIILDFENGVDLLFLSSEFGPSFGDLELTENGNHVEIALGDFGSILLLNMAGDLDASDIFFN